MRMIGVTMRHERWRRLLVLWRREAGRDDPMWPPEGLWSSGETIGSWGLSTAHGASLARMQSDYLVRAQALEARHRAEKTEFVRQRDKHLQGFTARAERDLSNIKHLELMKDSRMVFVDGSNRVELCRFVGKRRLLFDERRTKKRGEHASTILINGDGFDDQLLQRIQAELRRDLPRTFGTASIMTVPHLALTAAGIDIGTVRRIASQADGGHSTTVRVVGPTADDLDMAVKRLIDEASPETKSKSYWNSSTHSYRSNGRQFTVRVTSNNQTITLNHQVWHQALDALPAWHALRDDRKHKDPKLRGWSVTEFRHRLGASVFSAVDQTGERHRFISAFDQQENPPLYFLAQLPDQGRCFDYDEAIALLAPPIVHQARRDGRLVFRQGDVFFVQTDLSDETIRSRDGTIVVPTEEGSPADRNIYLTGHVATRVALFPSGVTLASGVVTHHPDLTERDREPEHRPLNLGNQEEKPGWFLAIRNCVPRSAANQDSGNRPGVMNPDMEGEAHALIAA